jgi:hypothetical protein
MIDGHSFNSFPRHLHPTRAHAHTWLTSLQKAKDTSNAEWWWVISKTGEEGYLPANYLSPVPVIAETEKVYEESVRRSTAAFNSDNPMRGSTARGIPMMGMAGMESAHNALADELNAALGARPSPVQRGRDTGEPLPPDTEAAAPPQQSQQSQHQDKENQQQQQRQQQQQQQQQEEQHQPTVLSPTSMVSAAAAISTVRKLA